MTPVKPVDAATVILVRQGVPHGTPWQCFMVRRHVRSEFAADVFVFPGGKVDPADWQDAPHCLDDHDVPHGVKRAQWLALKLAAVRELFEEAGVLLARSRSGGMLAVGREGDVSRWARYRRQVHDGALTLRQIADREGLSYAGDALHAFSHWITPVDFPRRYDTWFYVSCVPPHQEALHDAGETTDGVWISPGQALGRCREGTFPLVFATEQQLVRMARYPSIEQLIASVGPADLEAVMPQIVMDGEEQRFLLPGDPGYTAQVNV